MDPKDYTFAAVKKFERDLHRPGYVFWYAPILAGAIIGASLVGLAWMFSEGLSPFYMPGDAGSATYGTGPIIDHHSD